jgi:hypothetical protein
MSQFTDDPRIQPDAARPVHPVTPPMVLALKQTRPWVLFLSILGFIFGGLAIVGGIIMAAVMGFAGSLGGELSQGMGAAMGIGLGALYLLMGVVYLFPSLYLLRFASGIAAMLGRDPVGGMESALRAQKSFWKFAGIFMIVILCLYVLAILGVMLFAGIMAVRGLPAA